LKRGSPIIILGEEETEMKKGWAVLSLIICFGLGFFAGSLYYFGKLKSVNWGRAYEMSDIIGASVKNLLGEEYGKVSDIVVDTNGRVHFAVLSYGEKSVAIPFEALMFDPAQNYVVLDLSSRMLDSAPAFDKSQLANRTWVEDYYRRFGQVPYWTEAESGKKTEGFPSNAPGTGYAWP